jgi:hypothetical protein
MSPQELTELASGSIQNQRNNSRDDLNVLDSAILLEISNLTLNMFLSVYLTLFFVFLH